MATEIVLEGYGKLNIKEGTYFPLNFNIQNLTKPESTPSSYSKDIIIIGDKEANKILGQAFDVNITDSSYDINKKVGCNIIQDDATVFDKGFFQLRNVRKTGQSLPNGEPEVEYTARVKSNLLSFFTSIKDIELTDLNLGGFDTYQQVTRQNILDSFTNDSDDQWKYIPAYKATNSNNFLIKEWRPGIFAKTFWDEIHNQNGWEYEFKELEDLKFDKLIIPYTNEFDADEDTKDFSEVEYTNGGFQQYELSTSVGYEDGQVNNDFMVQSRLIFLNEIKDNFDQFNINTSNFQADFSSTYNFKYEFDYEHTLVNPTNDDVSAFRENLFNGGEYLEYKYALAYRKYDSSGNLMSSNYPFGLRFTSSILVSSFEGKDPKFNYPSGTGYTLLPGTNIVNEGNLSIEFSEAMNIGEEIRNIVLIEYRSNPSSPGQDIIWSTFTLDGIFDEKVGIASFLNTNSSSITVTPELEYNTGTPIYLQQFIPRDIKQRDFIKSFIDMYKLVVDVDPNQENKIIYTTRDKYYDDGTQIKWTDKLDKKKPINLEWLVDKQPKKMKFTYTQDEDEYNKAYFNHIKDVYGEFEYDFGNDYNVGEKKTEIIFSPTPIQYVPYGNMYLPSLPLTDIENLNIRLLIDSGTKTDGYWTLQNDDGSNSTQILNDYPYFGHLDDPVQPSYDINFGTCEFYFYNTWEFTTDNNLFNMYHRRYISQLTKGRIMTAYFKLTPVDILELKLNSRIEINDSWWNINRVIDYNANSDSPTKVELVTIDDGISIKPTRKISVGKPNPTKPYVGVPTLNYGKAEIFKTNTISKGFVGDVYGVGNNLSKDSQGVVIGNYNTMGGNSMVIGDKSSDSGLTGKLVVGTNKIADDEYNAFIGGTKIGESININETEFTNSGMVYSSEYVDNDYVVDGYLESVDANVTFGYTQSGGGSASSQIILQGDSAVFNVNEVSFSGATISGLSGLSYSLSDSLSVGNSTNNNDLVIDSGDTLDIEGIIDLTDAEVVGDIIAGTYGDIEALKTSSDLQPGRTYHLTDKDIWLKAIDNDAFDIKAARRMRCPLETYYTPQTISGTFDLIYLGIYGQTIDQGSVPNSDAFIGGDVYRAIWGGKLWQRDTSGADGGTSIQDEIDGGGWTEVSSAGSLYEDCYFSISYNFDDDNIEEQRDWKGNVVYGVQSISIDSTDWNLSTITYNETSGIYNNFDFSIITNNRCVRSPIYFNQLDGNGISGNIQGGGIFNNVTTDNIYANIIEGAISGNTVIGIARNKAEGITNNDMSSYRIERNDIQFNISGNSCSGNIANNSNTGFISNNSCGLIQYNSCLGNITNNDNSGSIQYNSNRGDISDATSSVGNITYNMNNGYIDGSAITGAISDTIVNKT